MRKKFLALVAVMSMALLMIPGVAMAGSTDSCTANCTHEAKVGDTHYDTIEEAIRKANGKNKTVVLLKDVTRTDWHQWGTTADETNYPTLNNITIDGNGKTLNVTTITSNGNGDYLVRAATDTTIKNLTVNAPNGFSLASGSTLENCTIDTKNNPYGVVVGSKVTITGCTFRNCTHAIYTDGSGNSADVVITNNTFDCLRATILRNNEEFTGNTMTANCTKGVTVSSTASSTITDNTFEEGSRINLYTSTGTAPTISGNTISGSVEVADDKEYDITGNTITDTATVPGNVTHDPIIVPNPASSSGISVTYNGGDSFSTSKSAVPTGVEIDGVAVPFSGDGRNFTVGCIDPGAKWITVRWNSTSVTTNFSPDASVVCTQVAIPKTGDMPLWAAVMAFFGL